MVVAGHTHKTAALQMGLSVETVKDYTRSSRLKLGACNTTRAAVLVAQLDKQ